MNQILNIFKTIIIIFFLTLICGAKPYSNTGKPVDLRELYEVFQSKDLGKIKNTLNDISSMRHQGKLLGFLLDVWNQKKTKYPELSWSTLNKDIIRLNITNILVQAKNNGFIEIDIKEMHKYVLSLVDVWDKELAGQAIRNLSLFRDQKDVPLLLSIAKRNERSTFRYSIMALSTMCIPSALEALEKLKKSFTDKKIILYLEESIRKSKKLQKIGYCDDF